MLLQTISTLDFLAKTFESFLRNLPSRHSRLTLLIRFRKEELRDSSAGRPRRFYWNIAKPADGIQSPRMPRVDPLPCLAVYNWDRTGGRKGTKHVAILASLHYQRWGMGSR